MIGKRKLLSLKCRLCHQEEQQGMVPLYGSATPKNQCIADKISTFIGTEVRKYDRLPKYICQSCLSQLEESYQFSMRCRSALNKLVQPKTDLHDDGRCLICYAVLNKGSAGANSSACNRWNLNITDMMQQLSGAVRKIRTQRDRSLSLVCDCCLGKMESAHGFKIRCLASDESGRHEVSHPWERMEVDKSDQTQLVVDLFANVVQEWGETGLMVHCSVCLLEVEQEQLGDKCEGCGLTFRDVTKKPRTLPGAVEIKSKADVATREALEPNKTDVEKELTSDGSCSLPSPQAADDSEVDNDSESDIEAIQQHVSQKHLRYKRVESTVYRCCVKECLNHHWTKERLNNHYRLAHPQNDTVSLENYCQYCDNTFPTTYRFMAHCRYRHVQYRCQIDGCKLTVSNEQRIIAHCNENPHPKSNSCKRDKERKNSNIRKNPAPDLKHFVVIGSKDDCIDILKRESEFCCRCFLLFDTKEEREAHCRTHGVQKDFPLQCETCGLGYPDQRHLLRHQNMRDDKIHHYCRECKKMLWAKVSYTRHKALYHFPGSLKENIGTELSNRFNCCGCDETFNTEAEIVAHRWRNHPPTPEQPTGATVKCDKCHLIVNDLKEHYDFHERQITFKCKTPGCAFRSKCIERAKTHIISNVHVKPNGSRLLPMPVRAVRHRVTRKPFTCCVCGIHADDDYGNMIDHAHTAHANKREYNANAYEQLEFRCLVCLKGFALESTMFWHILRTRTLYCSGCKKTHPVAEKLSHVNCKKKTKCEICDKQFASAAFLKNHLQNVHIDNTKHVCFICGKSVIKLKAHLMSHETERKWECKECPLRFKNYDVMLKHQRVHDGIRKFSCRQGCEKSYKSAGDRDRHEKLVHLGILPFACEFCSSAFVRERDLRLHMRKHTGQKLFPCSKCADSFDRKTDYDEHTSKCIRSVQSGNTAES